MVTVLRKLTRFMVSCCSHVAVKNIIAYKSYKYSISVKPLLLAEKRRVRTHLLLERRMVVTKVYVQAILLCMLCLWETMLNAQSKSIDCMEIFTSETVRYYLIKNIEGEGLLPGICHI